MVATCFKRLGCKALDAINENSSQLFLKCNLLLILLELGSKSFIHEYRLVYVIFQETTLELIRVLTVLSGRLQRDGQLGQGLCLLLDVRCETRLGGHVINGGVVDAGGGEARRSGWLRENVLRLLLPVLLDVVGAIVGLKPNVAPLQLNDWPAVAGGGLLILELDGGLVV